MDYKHKCDTIYTHFQGITDNIYTFGRPFLLLHFLTHPLIFPPIHIRFTYTCRYRLYLSHLCLFTPSLCLFTPSPRYEAPRGAAPPRLLPAPQPDPSGGAGAPAGAATAPHGREEEPAGSVPPRAAELGGHAAGRRPAGADERHVGGTHWGRNLKFYILWPGGLATVNVTRPHTKNHFVILWAKCQMDSWHRFMYAIHQLSSLDSSEHPKIDKKNLQNCYLNVSLILHRHRHILWYIGSTQDIFI